jgi:hypothetical protein
MGSSPLRVGRTRLIAIFAPGVARSLSRWGTRQLEAFLWFRIQAEAAAGLNAARPLISYLCAAPMSLSGSQVAISGNMLSITIASIMQAT